MDTTAKKVLCPIEFDASLPGAIDLARRLVEGTDGTLYLMHVVASGNDPAATQRDLKGARARLEQICRDDLPAVAPQIVVRTGEPVEEVLKAEREFSIDLVVIPTHKHSALFPLLSDGVSHAVIDESECLVMAVPEKVWEER